MRFPTILIALFILTTSEVMGQETQINSKGWVIDYFDITDPNRRLGSISRIVSPTGDLLFQAWGNTGLFEWDMNGAYPAEFRLIRNSETNYTYAVNGFITPEGNDLPVKLDMNLLFSSQEVNFNLKLTVEDVVRFEKGFGTTIPLTPDSRVDFTGATGDSASFSMFEEVGSQRRNPFQNLIKVSSWAVDLFIVLRNPLHPTPLLTQDQLELEVLLANRPVSTRPEGLGNICSILEPGDTVQVSWSIMAPDHGIHNDNYLPCDIAAFSAHPAGAEQSILFAFDDIPSKEPIWAVPTDADNSHTPVTSNLLSLLDIYPDVKFTWLMLTDDIQRLGRWYWKNWWPPNNRVIPDSTIVHGGSYSCRMTLGDDPSGDPAIIMAFLPVEPNRDYRIGGFRKVIMNEGGDIYLAVTVFDWPKAELIIADLVDLNDTDWNSFDLFFNSGDAGLITATFRVDGNAADLFLDDIHLFEDGSDLNIMPNNGLEDFRPFIVYDPAEPEWYNARGNCRIATEATAEYKNWLMGVQDETWNWSYNSQVGLGLHGMHHTPDSNFVRYPEYPQHEFDYYDPFGDSLRMVRITDDLESIGLDPQKILSFFRFPGHRHTESILKPLIQHNCRIIDHALVADTENYFGRIFRHGGMIWQCNSVSWRDPENDHLTVNLRIALDKGFFALLGAHYHFLPH